MLDCKREARLGTHSGQGRRVEIRKYFAIGVLGILYRFSPRYCLCLLDMLSVYSLQNTP